MRDRLLIMANPADDESTSRLSRNLRLRDMGFDTAPIAQVVISTFDKGLMTALTKKCAI
ncbi:hypothetical protein [Nostoc sp. MG11]|uniref:hypothetical protein n=1 Tax=Nostoc sp. MG11 TaxID=2721166 RepID=UPI0018666DF7|nr:hypothetical protein [Nostoc sp. MG11]